MIKLRRAKGAEPSWFAPEASNCLRKIGSCVGPRSSDLTVESSDVDGNRLGFAVQEPCPLPGDSLSSGD